MNDLALRFDDLLNRHRVRDFGRSGCRRVLISVFTSGARLMSYQIDHAWRRNLNRCTSIHFLSKPNGMRGSFVKIDENVDTLNGPDVRLKLASARSSTRISEECQAQQLLGTDFIYHDLFFWYPFSLAPISIVGNFRGIDIFRCKRNTRLGAGELCIAIRDDGEIVYRSEVVGRELRVWSVADWAETAIPCPASILVSKANRRFESQILLEEFNCEFDLPAGLTEFDVPDSMICEFFRSMV